MESDWSAGHLSSEMATSGQVVAKAFPAYPESGTLLPFALLSAIMSEMLSMAEGTLVGM
jgi:hypothetical protein